MKEKLIIRCLNQKLAQKVKNHTGPRGFRDGGYIAILSILVHIPILRDFKGLERLSNHFFVSGVSFWFISLWIERIYIAHIEKIKIPEKY